MTLSPYTLLPMHQKDGVFVSSRPVMSSISREIEDVVIENGLSVDVYAGFQRFSYLVQQEERYQRLAQTCRRVYVWGVPDIPPPDIRNIEYIALSDDMDLAHEWFLVIDSPDFFTALLGREDVHRGNPAQLDEHFEGIWTHDSHLVTQAVWRASQILGVPYNPVVQRNYEEQSRYLARIFTGLMQRREQRRLEQALAQHRSAFLHSVLASSTTPLLLLDESKTIVAASQSACDILKEELSTIVGQPLHMCGDGLFARRDPTLAEPSLLALLNVSDDEVLAADSKPIRDDYHQIIGWVISLHYINHQRVRVPRPRLPIVPTLHGFCDEVQQQLSILPSLVARPESHQRAVAYTQRLVDKLSLQIQRLSLLHDIEAQGEIDMTQVSVGTLLRPIFEEARHAVKKHGIMLLLDVPAGLPTLWCDQGQVRLALREMLTNLAQHAEGCSIARLRASQENGYIYLSVQDNGCGMSQEEQEHVFEPFARLRRAQKPYERIGLGLALVRAVAKAHHGHFRVRSKPGRGSNFTLMLPALS